MPEFDEQQFQRAYYLLAVYAHELIRRQEYMPLSIWKSHVKDENFDSNLDDLLEQGLVLEMEVPEGRGFAITEAGQALVWLYSDVLREIWKKNMNGEGDELIDFLVANLDAYANEQVALARQAAEAENVAAADNPAPEAASAPEAEG